MAPILRVRRAKMKGDTLMPKILVVDYDPGWPAAFESLRSRVWPHLQDVALSIEHVGSTSVPGLAAKPIIDMTIIVPGPADVPIAITRLAKAAYVHRGDLGVTGREAFQAPEGLPAHHLYLCVAGNEALRNHLAVRDFLRAHPEAAREYGALKKRLAESHTDDIDAYVEGKSEFLLAILARSGFSLTELDAIRGINAKR